MITDGHTKRHLQDKIVLTYWVITIEYIQSLVDYDTSFKCLQIGTIFVFSWVQMVLIGHCEDFILVPNSHWVLFNINSKSNLQVSCIS